MTSSGCKGLQPGVQGGGGRAVQQLPLTCCRLGSYRCCGLLTLPREPSAGQGIVALAANNVPNPAMQCSRRVSVCCGSIEAVLSGTVLASNSVSSLGR